MPNDDLDTNVNPVSRPPLGLPTGSVRALLTMLIVAVVVVETVRGRAIDEIWSETLLIALAHYFTSRRFVGLSRNVLQRLEDEGEVPKEANPLFLPRHSIRALIVLTFAALGYYVVGVERKTSFAEIPPVLITVSSYLLGVFVRGMWHWRSPGGSAIPSRFWEDLKATAVLLAMLATAIPYFLDHGQLVSPQVRSATLALVLFYFGSR